jgi:hypothetical protein
MKFSRACVSELGALQQHPLMALPLAAFKRYERQLSAVAMLCGFAFDNYFFGRVDHPATQVVLLTYVVATVLAVLALHFVESWPVSDQVFKKGRPALSALSQFTLGGLWSAFLIFYGRSAVVGTSWPFLALLAAMLVGNEVFRKYHTRLAFTCTLLFFAIFSYTIFALPMLTGQMGQRTFLTSGALSVGAFLVVLFVLRVIGRERIQEAWRGIALGSLGVFAAINIFYFTNILPPLPLTLANAGVFHGVTKQGDTYRVVAEQGPWLRTPGTTPVMHVASGERLYLYSAVFAPIMLKTDVLHIWQHYDDAIGRWQTEASVRFSIMGGREGGYRGYSVKSAPHAGRWRVNIETPDGLLIGRVPFVVAAATGAVKNVEQILR